MFEQYALFGLLIQKCNGTIVGRKKLQKMAYIAQILGYPIKERFSFHIYGPYSLELSGNLMRMQELNLINEYREGNSYIIELTGTGDSFSNNFRDIIINKMGKNKFKQMEKVIQKLHTYDAWQLEILATLLYFRDVEQRDPTILEGVLKNIKPKFNPEDIHNMSLVMQDLIHEFSIIQ